MEYVFDLIRSPLTEYLPAKLVFGTSFKQWREVLALLLPYAVFHENTTDGLQAVSESTVGKLPTMGWNSWKAYEVLNNHNTVLEAAKGLNDTGLKDLGYVYVNMDDGWQSKQRTSDGHLEANPVRYPDGIAGLAEQVHALGLKLGIYSTGTPLTCGKNPGSLDHETTDAKDFVDWGVDYLKYDNCNIPHKWEDEYDYCLLDCVKHHQCMNLTDGTCLRKDNPKLAPAMYNWSTSNTAKRYRRMSMALQNQQQQATTTGREILFAMCIWGTADVYSWGSTVGISWRATYDMGPSWTRVAAIINVMSFKTQSTTFYAHNDADVLFVGHPELTIPETRTHFALWAAIKSPLLVTANITSLNQTYLDILRNEYLIAFNQDDVHAASATPFKWGTNPNGTFNTTHPAEYWAGTSQKGTLVLMINTLPKIQTKSVLWSEVLPSSSSSMSYNVTDIWTGSSQCVDTSYSVDVASHDTAGILIGAEC